MCYAAVSSLQEVSGEIADVDVLKSENLICILRPEEGTLPTFAYRVRKDAPLSWFDTYNFAARRSALYYGALAMFDLLLLPFMFPLYVTEYRWVPIQKSLDTHGGSLQPNDILQIFKQAFFLLLDGFVLIPTVPLLWIARYRFGPIEAKLETNFVEKVSLTCQLYALAYKQFFMLLADALFLVPTLPFIYLYNIRSKPVKRYFEDMHFAKEVEVACEFYSEAWKQFIFMFLDGFILIPLVPVLWITRLRYAHVKAAIDTAFGSPENVDDTCVMYSMAIVNSLLLSADAAMSPFILVLFLTRVRYAKIMNIMYREDLSISVCTTFHFYWAIMQSTLILVTDIMFIPVFAVLFATQIHWPGVYYSVLEDMKHNYMTAKETDYEFAVWTYLRALWLGLCIFVDLAMAPLVVILMVTRVRWFPIQCDLLDADISEPTQYWRTGGSALFRLWGSILASTVQLCADIAVLPIALIVLVTWYRSWNMRQIWSHPYCYYIGAVWHTNVCLNFATIVLYDIPSVVLGASLAFIPLWTGHILRILHFTIFREYKKCDFKNLSYICMNN